VLYRFPTKEAAGLVPFAGLIDLSGTLYGTTFKGGAHGHGTQRTAAAPTMSERSLHSA
jgi:hypothetical protein